MILRLWLAYYLGLKVALFKLFLHFQLLVGFISRKFFIVVSVEPTVDLILVSVRLFSNDVDAALVDLWFVLDFAGGFLAAPR